MTNGRSQTISRIPNNLPVHSPENSSALELSGTSLANLNPLESVVNTLLDRLDTHSDEEARSLSEESEISSAASLQDLDIRHVSPVQDLSSLARHPIGQPDDRSFLASLDTSDIHDDALSRGSGDIHTNGLDLTAADGISNSFDDALSIEIASIENLESILK